jgi:hypothetical protein
MRIAVFALVVAVLVPFAIVSGMYVKNRLQYSISLYEFSNNEQDLTLLKTSCGKYPTLPIENQELCAFPGLVDNISVFDEALQCINAIFCTVKYDETLHYPVYISYDKQNRLAYFVLYESEIGMND